MAKVYQDNKEYFPAVARVDKANFTQEERLKKVALSGTSGSGKKLFR